MYINYVSHYIPSTIIKNDYYEKLTGVTNDWLIQRTGIKERRKTTATENTNSMAIESVKAGLDHIDFDIEEIDLIVGATYTPYDTIITLAHAVQNYLNISNIPVVTVSSACSSLLNAVEVVQGYFSMNKANKALVIVSDNNTLYNDDSDKVSGHLWGDGACTLFISKERINGGDLHIKDIITRGAANKSKALHSINLRPGHDGIKMPDGKDIFINACCYIKDVAIEITRKNNYLIDDINYLIPHQANRRITDHLIKSLSIDDSKVISNIERLGNTGCAGCGIALSEQWNRFKKGDIIVVSVFGGGYSYGAMILTK